MTNAWDELLKTALLGSERKALPEFRQTDQVSGLLSGFNGMEPENRLLSAMAVLGTYRLAGFKRQKVSYQPSVCEPEQRLYCSQRASDHLGRMLSGEFPQLLAEWFSVLSSSGKIIPPEFLPTILDLGTMRDELRAVLKSAVGNRGAWMARLDPEWRWAAGGIAENVPAAGDLWKTGERWSRIALLEKIRGKDPQLAIDLIRSTWNEDPPEEKALFISKLNINLGLKDEDFLEGLLDDRRKEIRIEASDLLRRLPGSRLVLRMQERAEGLIKFESGKTGVILKLGAKPPKIEVFPPSEFNPGMLRDGMRPKPSSNEKSQGMGERAFWVLQIISSVPPSLFCEITGAKPESLLAAASQSDWMKALVLGWARAAINFRDEEWARALFEHSPFETSMWDLIEEHVPALLGVLPPNERERLLLTHMPTKQGEGRRLSTYSAFFIKLDHQWSDEFAGRILDFYFWLWKEAKEPVFSDVLTQCAMRSRPSIYYHAEKAAASLAEDSLVIQKQLAKVLSLFGFRLEMHKALENSY